MKITLLCSCGLLLEHEGSRLLIDAPNSALPPFYRLPDEAFETLCERPLDGLVFTHLHPDHYDPARAAALLAAHPGAVSFLPGEDTPPLVSVQAGAFRVECRRLAHTPAPQFQELPHYVLFVSVGERSVYIAADAAPDAPAHRAALAGRRTDAAFFNSQCLAYPALRALVREAVGRVFLYHLPPDPADGIRRACTRALARLGTEAENVRALTEYPVEIRL